MACGTFSSSTSYLKVATFVSLLAFILQIAGLAVPRWSTLSVSATLYGFINFDTDYHTGLWKDCVCVSTYGTETCACYSKVNTPEWLKAVQALEVIGFICCVVSLCMTLRILLSRQGQTAKKINIGVTACGGMLIVIGITIFGIENRNDYEELFEIAFNVDTKSTLAVAFGLSTTAGLLCLLVCLPLLVVDYKTPVEPHPMQINPMPVRYNNQGYLAMPPPGQTHFVVNNTAHNPMGYMRSYPHETHVNINPAQGQSMQPPPAYPYQSQYGVKNP